MIEEKHELMLPRTLILVTIALLVEAETVGIAVHGALVAGPDPTLEPPCLVGAAVATELNERGINLLKDMLLLRDGGARARQPHHLQNAGKRKLVRT
ncbi:hypothetical protein DIZ76_014867 [Coccidioides immitis]|nr:hypothetical protein DIZ76_014867 [Coccidioides immitis]